MASSAYISCSASISPIAEACQCAFRASRIWSSCMNCPQLRPGVYDLVVPAACFSELSDATDRGKLVTRTSARLQPFEQAVLGPSPVGARILRCVFGGGDGRGNHRVHTDS